jgi:hypothetical protein
VGQERQRVIVPVSIAAGQSLSAEVNVDRLRIVGIQMPAAWTAAGITFAVLLREPPALPKVPVFGKLQDQAGVEVLVTAPAADTYVVIAATALSALGRLKVRSGTAGAPVNQVAQADFFLVCVER